MEADVVVTQGAIEVGNETVASRRVLSLGRKEAGLNYLWLRRSTARKLTGLFEFALCPFLSLQRAFAPRSRRRAFP